MTSRLPYSIPPGHLFSAFTGICDWSFLEEANAAEQSPNQQAGNTQAAKKMNVPGHFGSEKYGSWMLVSRKERRNRNRRMNPPGEAPSSFNGQDTRRNIGPVELGTQSRFAALENLDDEPGQDQ
nr:uncharacterized protein LOC109173079 [Ipomoea batatas]